jgi:rubrerythrin
VESIFNEEEEMANLFVASEILEMNVAEERNGAAYYAALSESAQNEKLRKAAAEISQQEKNHEKRFIDLLDQVRQREPEESYPGEFDAYIKPLMGNRMFPDEEAARKAAKSKSDADAVKLALKTEEATLNLLNALKKHIEPDEMKYVNLTIQEEEDHVTRLNEILQELES